MTGSAMLLAGMPEDIRFDPFHQSEVPRGKQIIPSSYGQQRIQGEGGYTSS
jgi:hypothetical protein